jgi:predicted TIM-barrel fold metal-dependent hydrolase
VDIGLETLMPIIDLSCYYGVTPATLALPTPDVAAARAYADQFNIELLCFQSSEANTDIVGGNVRLAEWIVQDARFRGWLTLSVHQPEASLHIAAHYLRHESWIGTRIEQTTEADSVAEAGGHEVLNGMRRFGHPVLLTVNSPATLHAAVEAAREFHTLRFVLAPQNEAITTDMLPAIRELTNVSLLPTAAFIERDVIAQAVTTLGDRGERRVLWGSDWGRFHPTAALGMMKDTAISGPQRERILYRNARELLA